MGEESPKPASTPTGAVFLSYASQDAEAALRICMALRAADIEVWFDQSALRGGDLWDQTIRKQIKACALFIPLISRHTHERKEGYFRLEWKLAVDRSNLISATQAFLLPVVIDDTHEDDEEVPEKIRDIHWTRLPGGETPTAFVERVQRLLAGEASTPGRGPSVQSGAVGTLRAPVQAAWPPKRWLFAIVAVTMLAALAYFATEKHWISKPAVSSPTVAASAAPTAFNPPPHSIAVLPFANMSGDKDQEYFSDGLTEEILNSLTRINELQVAGRTSSFYFKGKDVDLSTVAHTLNVAAVLEGSVRRSGHTVRVTTQLINTTTGFHLWSEKYDRDLGDVLKLETEIANAVAGALRVTLLGDLAARIELGGTRNPAARDAYLRATKAHFTEHQRTDIPAEIAAYSEAIHLDPNYALAFAGRSIMLSIYAQELRGSAMQDAFDKAQNDARRAIALAPELGEGHLALALCFQFSLNLGPAMAEFDRALALAPGSARVLRDYGYFAVTMGRTAAGIAAARRGAVLDPLNSIGRMTVGDALFQARRYDEALTTYQDVIALDPDTEEIYARRGLVYYLLEDLQSARSSCEAEHALKDAQECLAVVYDRLGRHADAESALAKVKASRGDTRAYEYATIYAQWGKTSDALHWLETALRIRDTTLHTLKTDPLIDPLRKEPRFQAIERELKFPD